MTFFWEPIKNPFPRQCSYSWAALIKTKSTCNVQCQGLWESFQEEECWGDLSQISITMALVDLAVCWMWAWRFRLWAPLRTSLVCVIDNSAVDLTSLFSSAYPPYGIRERLVTISVQILTQIHRGYGALASKCIRFTKVQHNRGKKSLGLAPPLPYYRWALDVPYVWVCVRKTYKMSLKMLQYLRLYSTFWGPEQCQAVRAHGCPRNHTNPNQNDL